jgi:hypothetical protein
LLFPAKDLLFGDRPITDLFALLYYEPTALLIVEVERLYGRSLCGCSIRRIDETEEKLRPLAEDERSTPRAELLGGVLLWLFGHVARALQIVVPSISGPAKPHGRPWARCFQIASKAQGLGSD